MQTPQKDLYDDHAFSVVEKSNLFIGQIDHTENTWGTQNQVSGAGLVDADGEGLDANSAGNRVSYKLQPIVLACTRQRSENPFDFQTYSI